MPLPLQQFMCRWAWLICLISLWSPAPWTDREKKNNKGELISAQPFIYLLQALKKPFLAGLRVGEAFQTTEILVSSGEGTPCQLDSLDSHPGKSLSSSHTVNTYKLFQVGHFKYEAVNIENIVNIYTYHQHISLHSVCVNILWTKKERSAEWGSQRAAQSAV